MSVCFSLRALQMSFDGTGPGALVSLLQSWQAPTDLAGQGPGACGTCAWGSQPSFRALAMQPSLTDPCPLRNAVWA